MVAAAARSVSLASSRITSIGLPDSARCLQDVWLNQAG
jgi:hypothetical protein